MTTFTETPLAYHAGGTTHTRTYTCTTCDTEFTLTVTFLWHDDLNGFTKSNLDHLIHHATTCTGTRP